eukprot:Selendium_serpulae@DN6452_c0_g2_i1.p2
MKALILVGGYGTRLRPLTLSVPKPLIQFCNKSIVEHQINALVKAGVNHVILAVAYQPEAMDDALKELETKFGVKVTCSREEEPLGTAGPIRLAKDIILEDDGSNCFFVCNSDVICEFPLGDMLKYHISHGGEGTVLVKKVENPSAYGVVVSDTDEPGRISRFVEKPQEFVGDNINAGLYILNKSVVDRIEPRPTSIEKETFPAMAADKVLFGFQLNGYWADIGKPKDFLSGMQLYLDSLKQAEIRGEKTDVVLSKGDNIEGNVLIDPTAIIEEGAVLGPYVTVGAGCRVGKGARLRNTAVMSDVKVSDYAWVKESIIGWKSNIGRWVRIEGLTVVGQDVTVAPECYINKALILPHKSIASSIHQEGQIVM